MDFGTLSWGDDFNASQVTALLDAYESADDKTVFISELNSTVKKEVGLGFGGFKGCGEGSIDKDNNEGLSMTGKVLETLQGDADTGEGAPTEGCPDGKIWDSAKGACVEQAKQGEENADEGERNCPPGTKLVDGECKKVEEQSNETSTETTAEAAGASVGGKAPQSKVTHPAGVKEITVKYSEEDAEKRITTLEAELDSVKEERAKELSELTGVCHKKLAALGLPTILEFIESAKKSKADNAAPAAGVGTGAKRIALSQTTQAPPVENGSTGIKTIIV